MIDTIYSCGLSLVWDTIPDPLDRWNFGSKFPLTILPVTTVESELNGLPDNFYLSQNYPNPFNPITKIRFTIPSLVIASETNQSQLVTLKVFDILGNEIAILINEEKTAGTYEITWYAEDLHSGVYFYRFKAGTFIEIKKMVLMK